MRETWARRIALLTGLLVLLLSAVFALVQNPVEPTETKEIRIQKSPIVPTESVALDLERIETGRQIYIQQACARCHSIYEKGNQRNPLDNVGARRTAEELRDWIIGAQPLQDVLPERIFNLKKKHSELSDNDLDALIIYMQSLRP
jgi:cbb3-type cytochrome oxidase cytochrome c subunit